MTGKFIGELKRRNVPRAAILYIGSVWALAQGIASLGPELGAPASATRWFLIAAAIGFPFWLGFSWHYEFTAQGIKHESEIAPDAPKDRTANRRTDLIIIGGGMAGIAIAIERAAPMQHGAGICGQGANGAFGLA